MTCFKKYQQGVLYYILYPLMSNVRSIRPSTKSTNKKECRIGIGKLSVHMIFFHNIKIKCQLQTSDEILIISLFRMIYENVFLNTNTNVWVNHL